MRPGTKRRLGLLLHSLRLWPVVGVITGGAAGSMHPGYLPFNVILGALSGAISGVITLVVGSRFGRRVGMIVLLGPDLARAFEAEMKAVPATLGIALAFLASFSFVLALCGAPSPHSSAFRSKAADAVRSDSR